MVSKRRSCASSSTGRSASPVSAIATSLPDPAASGPSGRATECDAWTAQRASHDRLGAVGVSSASVPDTSDLSRDAWRPYFDELSRTLATTRATVEIDAPQLGAQLQAEDLILDGITYDDRDDVLVVALSQGGADESLQHFISEPKRISVETSQGVVPSSIEVEDGEGQLTLVRLEAAPALPAE